MSYEIKLWIYKIIVFMLFSTLLIQIAADKKYEKYIRFFSGIIVVLMVINPFLKIMKSENFFKFNYLEENFSQAATFAAEEAENISDIRNENVSARYKAQIQASIESLLTENGYELATADITLDDNKNSRTYFYPKTIYAKIKKKNLQDGERNVEVEKIESKIAEFFSMDKEGVTLEIV